MSKPILIDLDNQNTTDELVIDYTKVDLLKSYSNRVFDLFKTNIEFGDIAQMFSHSSTKEIKIWITLFGEKNDRIKAKKYIISLCNPEFHQKMTINEILHKKLQENNFVCNLIQTYMVHIEIENNKQIIIQGTLSDVSEVKCILDLELNRVKNTKNDLNKKKLKDDKNDEDIILINDPYEIFDRDHLNKKTNDNFSKKIDIQNSFNKLNFDHRQQKNVDLSSNQTISNSVLTKYALSKGFDQKDINEALKELNSTAIGEQEFVEYLKILTNFKQNNNQTSKKIEKKNPINSNEEQSECEIIAFFPKKGNSSTSSNNENSIYNKNENKSSKILDEYAQMVQTQEFDKENEKMNKVKRITKLISAMPDDQKATALHQFSKYKINNNKQNQDKNHVSSSPPIAIEDTTIQHVYNPILYQNTEDSNFNFLFSNFSDMRNSQINNITTDIETNEKSRNRRRNRTRKQSTNDNNVHRSVDRNNQNYFHIRSKSNNPRMYNNNSNNNDSNNSNNKNKQNSINKIHSVPNFDNQSKLESNSNLKYIFIDGSNVAREHGKEIGKVFSCKGIKIVVEYFLNRGHSQIKALVPRFRRGNSDIDCPSINPEILDELEEGGYLTYTPSRYVKNKLILPYDDRFILKAAHHYDGIIVSNDNYRDLMKENAEWKRLIENNLLQYSFIGDLFMIADDPMGRRGPSLDQFLSLTSSINTNTTTSTTTNNNFKNKKNKTNSSAASFNAPTLFEQVIGLDNFNKQNYSNSTNEINQITRKKSPRSINNDKADLIAKLKEMFPFSDSKISSLINQYRNINDVDFFVTKLIE